MELLILVLIAGVIFVVVGASVGISAKSHANQLQRRVDALERELKQLRSQAPPNVAAASMPTAGPTSASAAMPHEAAAAIQVPPLDEAIAAEPTPEPAAVADIGEGDTGATGETGEHVAEPSPAPGLAPAPMPTSAVEPPPLPAFAAAPEPAAEPTREPLGAPFLANAPATAGELTGVERMLGMRWLTWIGIGLLFLGVAFFLKYAYDRDWLGRLFGPRMRIVAAATLALAFAFSGWRSLKNGMAALGQGLLGGSQALLYLTVYAAFQPAVMVVDTPLFGTTTAFALMTMVTALGLAAAVRLDAVAMAFLAVLGGFATPLLIHRGVDARDALCAYLLLLDLGVLAVASYRRWRALDLLALAGTAVLFGGWYAAFRHLHPQPDATLAWLFAFHLVFLVLPFAQHWRRRTAVTVERFVLALANVAWTLTYAEQMLHETAPRLLAGAFLAGSVLYAGLGVVTAHRVGDDRRTRDGFFALAALLLTLGLFHLLPGDAVTSAWFAQAVAMLWLGYRFANRTTRELALAVLLVAALRTLFVHLPDAHPDAAFAWNPWLLTLLTAGVGVGAFGWVHDRYAIAVDERMRARVCGIGAALWALAVGTGEVLRDANGHPTAWLAVTPALAIAWLQLAGTVAFFAWARRWPARSTFFAGMLPLLAAAIAVGVAYDRYPPTALAVLNGPCLTGLAVVLALAVAGTMASRQATEPTLRATLFGAAQLALTTLLTIETASFVQRGDALPTATSIGQSLAWVWLVMAIAGVLAATAWSSRRVLALAMIPLLAAAGCGLWLFAFPLAPHRLIANQRFLFNLLVSGVVSMLRLPLRRLASPATADHAATAALLLLLICCGFESVTWSLDTCTGPAIQRWIVRLLGATAVAGSAGACWRARATGNDGLRSVGLMVLLPATVLPLTAYVTVTDASWMFVNLRVGLIAAAIATMQWWARGDEKLRQLSWCAFAIGLLALTLEPPTWLLDHVDDAAEAHRLALFSITVTWITTAVLLLVVGFRRERRQLRLVALGLFVLTAAKLLLIDMSGAQQLYRILAFLIVGIVLVLASWTYHRVERRLAAARESEADTAP